MSDVQQLATALTYMERKALRRTSRGKRPMYSSARRLRELGLTEPGDSPYLDRLTLRGRGTLDALEASDE